MTADWALPTGVLVAMPTVVAPAGVVAVLQGVAASVEYWTRNAPTNGL